MQQQHGMMRKEDHQVAAHRHACKERNSDWQCKFLLIMNQCCPSLTSFWAFIIDRIMIGVIWYVGGIDNSDDDDDDA